MTFPDDLQFRTLRFDNNDANFVRACKEFKDYKIRHVEDSVQITKKNVRSDVYDVEIKSGKLFLEGRCTGPRFAKKSYGICKHIFIVAFHMIEAWLMDTKFKDIADEPVRTILEGIDALRKAPGINQGLLSGAVVSFEHRSLKTQELEEDDWDEDIVSETAQAIAASIPQGKIEKTSEKKGTGAASEAWNAAVAKLPKKGLIPQKVRISKNFGGTVNDLPKNLVTTLHGKPYVTVQGIIHIANDKGLVNVDSEPILWSHKNKDKRSIFKATVTFDDGSTFSAHGVAIPDGLNIDNKRMFPFVDHLAETRAVGRALRRAIAFGEPTVEELPGYQGGDE